MNIAIIGAAGAVGRQITQMIISERLLECHQRLVLVGNPDGASAASLPGLAVDLMDAYAEICPRIDVVFDPARVEGDLIIMAGGMTMPTGKSSGSIERDFLARQNLPVFERYAAALARHGHGHEIVICVSNPNELAVACFARHLGSRRVIGMGAFLDSWRFRKEIAQDLGIPRQKIHGYMIGEHGNNMVPLWSSIHIYGFTPEDLANAFYRIRREHKTANFLHDCAAGRSELIPLIGEGRMDEAFQLIEKYPPDIRTALKPYVTHFSGAKTANASARATLAMIQMISLGSDTLVAGQVRLEGDFFGLHSTIGVPFVIGNKGVDRIIQLRLDEDEERLLADCARNVQEKIDLLLGKLQIE